MENRNTTHMLRKLFNGRCDATRASRKSQESGLAIGEMLVLTVPLSLLSLALTSRMSTTATRRLDSLTQASTKAQVAARERSAVSPEIGFSKVAMLAKMAANPRITKSASLQVFAVPMIILTDQKETQRATANPEDYAYSFSQLANNMAPDALDQQGISSSATFLRNEPNGDGTGTQRLLGAWIFGNGLYQSHKLFTGSTDGSPERKDVEEPQIPDEVEKTRGQFESAYDKGLEKEKEKEKNKGKAAD